MPNRHHLMPDPETAAHRRDGQLHALLDASQDAADYLVSLHACERILATVAVDVSEDELAERLAILGHAAAALLLLADVLDAYPRDG